MKVLRNVCGHCGYLMLFSVEVLSRPGTADEILGQCPNCKKPASVTFLATELDIEEVDVEPSVEEILRSLRRSAH